MMCAYGVPFHMTHGPPDFGSSVMPSRSFGLAGGTMMCGGEATQWLSADIFVAHGSVLLPPTSPCSMYAMPPPGAAGGSVCFIQASAQPAHALSRHMGSFPPLGLTLVVGKQTHPLVPALSCFISPP